MVWHDEAEKDDNYEYESTHEQDKNDNKPEQDGDTEENNIAQQEDDGAGETSEKPARWLWIQSKAYGRYE